ncbi:hypothetical protein OESDEN_02298 [Oesophagostomum dentatum]|uniref:Uncharacterized protein n=1 Tax=Oesophagostomum dentatum TaxID=61180 RepID=A0A0B1TJL2_OESDE|nr:hypothetical protein OESDEN_02298 [Oesophagostomum dentatum]
MPLPMPTIIVNGATIRLVKSTGKNRDHKEQPTQIGLDYDGETFSIWSVGRERVASTKMMAHDGHILFYFSHHDCLIKKLGIRHFGLLNGKVYQIYEDKPVHNVSKGEGEAITYDTVKPRDTLGTLATVS